MIIPHNDLKILVDGDYEVDFFNNNPIFQVNCNDKNHFVRDWEQVYFLHQSPTLEDINFKYFATFILDQCDSNITPYKRIRRIPRGNNVTIKGNDFYLENKQIFANNKSFGNYYFEDLLNILEEKIVSKIKFNLDQTSGNVACEQSSGLDSNSILGLISGKIKFPKNRLYTVSGGIDEEAKLIRDFRKFYNLLNTNCIGPSISDEFIEEKDLQFDFEKQFEIYRAPALRGEDSYKSEILSLKKCTLLFSGLGGDQVISHHGKNVQSDLIKNMKFKELLSWYSNDNLPTKTKRICGRIIKLALKKPIELRNNQLIRGNIFKNILIRNLNDYGKEKIIKHIKYEYPWEFDQISIQKESMKKRVLSEWVCVRAEDEIRMNKSYGIKKIYPFLDEELISILLKINPTYFNKNGQERFLIRKLFKNYLPDYLYKNPHKKRFVDDKTIRKAVEIYHEKINLIMKEMNQKNYLAGKFWHIDRVLIEISSILNTKNPSLQKIHSCWLALQKIHLINLWLQKLS